MRIIGGSDYYDGAQSFGLEPGIFFKRPGTERRSDDDIFNDFGLKQRRPGFEISEADDKKGRRSPIYLRRPLVDIGVADGRLYFRPMHVILCGVHYTGITATHSTSWPYTTTTTRIWRAEALRDYVEGFGLHIHDVSTHTEQDWQTDKRGIRSQFDIQVESLDQWFTPVPVSDRCKERLIQDRITIISRDPDPSVWSKDEREKPWKIDGSDLSGMGFAKAVDPHTAFQEIAMWHGGVLGIEGPGTVEITDDLVKIHKAGFSHPESFRKPKEKSK